MTTKRESKKTVTLRMNGELQKRLKVYSATEGKKITDVVEEAIKKYLDENGGKN